MKTSLLLSFASLFVAASAFSANYYRTDNPDTNWAALENWSTDELGEVPATSLPKAGDYVRFADAAEGTTTIFDSSNGNITFERLLSTSNASVEFSSVTANVSNRIELNSGAGTADAYKTFNLTLSNGSVLTTWMLYGTKASYTNFVFDIKDNSTFSCTSGTWNHFQLASSNDSKATLNIEEGSSFKVGANFALNGTNNLAPRSEVLVNLYGNLQSNGLYVGDGTNSIGTMNIYGSASCILTASIQLKNKNSNLNFVLKNVGESRVAHVTDSQVEYVNEGIMSIASVSASAGMVFAALSGSVNIDLQDFSMNDWVVWETGETYAISLITVADSQYIFDASFINILNADKMGSWALASDDKSEYLKWDENTLNLYVTAVPEPSIYALMFGALALAFAFSRRARKI